MIKIKTFTLSGIGRFVDKQTIDFDKLGSLVQVDAENKNTGGSSGSGKTTIFHALEYNLGINDLSNSILQSRLTENGIYTLGEYEVDGKELKILRSKSKFSIEFDGETISGSSKITEEKLDQILGMDRKLFRPMLHKRQKEGGFFLDFTPSKMNDFLTSALGLSEYRQKLEVVDAKVKELLFFDQKFHSMREAACSGLKASYDALAALGSAPVVTVLQHHIDQLKSDWEASVASLKDIGGAFKTSLADLESQRPNVTVEPYNRAQIESLERARDIVSKKIDGLKKQERDRIASVKQQISEAQLEMQKAFAESAAGNKAANDAAIIAEEIKKIRASICPTCEQSWATESAKAKEAALISKLKQLKDAVSAGQIAQLRVFECEARIRSLHLEAFEKDSDEVRELQIKLVDIIQKIQEEYVKEKGHIANQNSLNSNILGAYEQKLKDLMAERDSQLAICRKAVEASKYEYESAVRKQRDEIENLVRHCKTVSTLETQIDGYKSTANDLEVKLSKLKEELEVAEEVRKAIKSYVSCSFDDALEEIGATATRILRAIPNMANATIQLEGIKETKEGKLKEEVNAVISMDGEVGVPIKSLSGGERSSVDLAVDLAVIDLLENKTNKGINVFILDEPFTGLDTVSIEMALEVLKNSNINKKLVIVDHNPEVKQMVESRLVVIRDGATSRVEQA